MSPGPRAALVVVLTAWLAPAAHADGPVLPNAAVTLQGLDKITARVSRIEARIGVPVQFGSLAITARACLVTPPTEPPESAAFLEIDYVRPGTEEVRRAFSGWMFASSPALSALEHPVYDVWVLECAEPIEEPGQPPASPPSAPSSIDPERLPQ